MTKVKRLDAPRYYHVTEAGHNWYLRSWSDFKGPARPSWWCDEHKDFHHGQAVDPLELPEDARRAFLTTKEAT